MADTNHHFFDIHTHNTRFSSSGSDCIVNYIIGEDDKFPQAPYISCGIHPWYIHNAEEQLRELEYLLGKQENIVAVGEAGPDKLSTVPFPLQMEIFMRQARLAEENGKPLIIHCVKSWNEIIISYRQIRPSRPWIIHGFRGKAELALHLLNEGFLLSFGLYFQPDSIRKAWRHRFFLETDDAGVDIGVVYEKAASALGVSIDELAKQIAENLSACNILPGR